MVIIKVIKLWVISYYKRSWLLYPFLSSFWHCLISTEFSEIIVSDVFSLDSLSLQLWLENGNSFAVAERVSQWPCAVCTKGCTTNAILCEYCGQWAHYSCESLSESEFNELSDITCGYVCTTCRVDRKGEFDFKKSLQRLTEASREASGAKTRGMDRRSCDRQPYKRMCFSEGCLGPLASLLDNELSSFILDRPTSSGLVKHISTKQSTIVSPEILDLDQVRLSRVRVATRSSAPRSGVRDCACPIPRTLERRTWSKSTEIYDVLNKLLKNDEDNASGDAMLLCKLFSGEACSYTYSTESNRDIPANTPFAILGCTQMPNAAKLIARMDQGQGLIDRFLLAVPNALCSTSDEVENARE